MIGLELLGTQGDERPKRVLVHDLLQNVVAILFELRRKLHHVIDAGMIGSNAAVRELREGLANRRFIFSKSMMFLLDSIAMAKRAETEAECWLPIRAISQRTSTQAT